MTAGLDECVVELCQPKKTKKKGTDTLEEWGTWMYRYSGKQTRTRP